MRNEMSTMIGGDPDTHFSLLLCTHIRRQPIRDHQGVLLLDPSTRNRSISVAKATNYFSFVFAGYKPQHLAGPVDNGICQCHPPSSLINRSDCDVRIIDVQDWVSWYQGCRVSIRAQTQVNKIQHCGRTRDLVEDRCILRSC